MSSEGASLDLLVEIDRVEDALAARLLATPGRLRLDPAATVVEADDEDAAQVSTGPMPNSVS